MENILSKTYGHTREVSMSFEDAILRTKEELAKEGFGVITEINVKETLKKKLDVDYDNYSILGACNPSFALRALNAEKLIGLFLPCNVVVFETEGKIFVSAIVPKVAMSMIDNQELAGIAIEVEEKLEKVINSI